MDKKLRHRAQRSNDLALVKAAAWAWHQHGSDRKPSIREFEAAPPRQTCGRPSRYKLEAVRMMEESSKEDDETSSYATISPEQADNSLLDRYEIESISKRLQYLIKSSSAHDFETEDGGGLYGGDLELRRRKSVSSDAHWLKKKKKGLKGLLGLRHGVSCGRNEDVEVKALIRVREGSKRFVHAP